MLSILPLIQYLKKQHVISICCYADNELWCANCFYIFDVMHMSFIIMTDTNTRHAILMNKNSQVSGTINGQPKKISLIKGVQYRGKILRLNIDNEKKRRDIYRKRFPISLTISAPMWEIFLDELKMTDNAVIGFSKKIIWKRTI